MTWYADEVLAASSPRVLQAIASNAMLAPFAYHLKPPLDHEWHTPGVIHGLPEGGLVVVRPICDVTPNDSPADWYARPALDWSSLTGFSNAKLVVDPTVIAERCNVVLEPAPPVGLLHFLRDLADETESIFVFYSCRMWGGEVEQEYAWIFGGK